MKRLLPILFLFLLSGCDKKQSDLNYSEYQLPRNCELNLEEAKDMMVIINDQAKLQQILPNHQDLQPINFNEYSLLLVKGTSSYGIEKVEKAISIDENSKCVLSITIMTNLACYAEPWVFAYIIPKTNTTDVIYTVSYV